jgi:hypothetical protein
MQSAIDLAVTLAVAPELRSHPARERRDAWRAARDGALLAYRCWTAAEPGETADAYAAYRAAEEREAAAAAALVPLVR